MGPHQALGGESVFLNTSLASKGTFGSTLPPTSEALRPQWVAGSAVEVAWGIRYNHGGGYAYRLCPAGEPLTEACFQRHQYPCRASNPGLAAPGLSASPVIEPLHG